MSKELEALEKIVDNYYIDNMDKEISIIATALKALEIIKQKEVNVFILLHSVNLKIYNDIVEDNRKLTQEKYDLLKEVLR